MLAAMTWYTLALLFSSGTACTALLGWLRETRARAELRAHNAKLGADLRELERKRVAIDAELERLKVRDPRTINVRELLPATMRSNPDVETANFCRLAFRAWITWANDCPVLLQFRELLTADLDEATRHTMACELYARATFESAFAAHFDGTNPRTDRAVLRQLNESLGEDFAVRVHIAVEQRGVVFAPTTQPQPAGTPH